MLTSLDGNPNAICFFCAWGTGEEVPAAVSAVLRWCWTVTGGRRLAHVVSSLVIFVRYFDYLCCCCACRWCSCLQRCRC